MSLKLKKLVDPSQDTLMTALIKDIPKFKEQVNNALDKLQIMIIEHFTRQQLMDKIHKIEEPEDLVALSKTMTLLPTDGIVKLAEYIDLHHSKEPDHIKVLLYLEIGKAVVRGSTDYINECCRQRMQAIARQEALIIKPKKAKIITQ